MADGESDSILRRLLSCRGKVDSPNWRLRIRGYGQVDSTMRQANTLRRGVWPGVVALAVVFSLFSTQVHLLALTGGSRDGSNVSDCCETHKATSAETICSSDLRCNDDACAHVAGSRQRDTSDDVPCCPNNCKHCSLPCCGGTLLGLCLPTISLGAPIPASLTLSASGIPPAVDLAGIFHPPRA
jgi:hypothetical protein